VLRIGIIGCGAIAQIAYLPILNRLRGVRVVALCDNDAAKARALAQRFEVSDFFTDIDELLEGASLDAVIVSTPNHLHEPHILSALRANTDVLGEQPLALSPRGIERIIAAAARTGRKVMAAAPHRFRTDVQALAGFLHGGELGTVVGIRAGAYYRRGSVEGWRTRRAEAGGGAFLEYGYTLLDLALWLANFPAPERVSAHSVRQHGASGVEDTMVALLTCAGGLACTLNVTWSYVGERDRWAFEVLASDGSARLGPLRVVKELAGRARDVTPAGGATRDTPLVQSHRAMLAHFAAVVRGDVAYEVPTDQATVARVMEAAYKSADEGREVQL
jgi:predicted dehydrogenase